MWHDACAQAEMPDSNNDMNLAAGEGGADPAATVKVVKDAAVMEACAFDATTLANSASVAMEVAGEAGSHPMIALLTEVSDVNLPPSPPSDLT